MRDEGWGSRQMIESLASGTQLMLVFYSFLGVSHFQADPYWDLEILLARRSLRWSHLGLWYLISKIWF
jgi:hypothetical protein